MKELTTATLRDSAAIKLVSTVVCGGFCDVDTCDQISYLTMIFLPANYLSVRCPLYQFLPVAYREVDRACSE